MRRLRRLWERDGGGGGGGGRVIFQLLEEQSEKMAKLSTALKWIQEGILKNNPQPAAEVLGSLVNTHKHLIESGVEFQKELESLPISKKMGLLRRPRAESLGDTPISLEKAEKRVAPSPPKERKLKKERGTLRPHTQWSPGARSRKRKGNGTWCKIKKKRKKMWKRTRWLLHLPGRWEGLT